MRIAATLLALSLSTCANLAPIAPAYPADNGQWGNVDPATRAWINGLRSPKGYCCDLADGHPLADDEWEIAGNGYRIRVGGKWVDVPPEAVLNEGNRLGIPIVWYRYDGDTLNIICFLAGGLV